MLRAKHMGFKNVRRVEVKAETTTPGEVRTTTDATGARVSTSRGRRTLPKLEFTVDEDGAILHGPQRGAFPHAAFLSTNNASTPTGHDATAMLDRDLLYQSASFHALHMRDFPSPPPSSYAQNDEEESAGFDDQDEVREDGIPKRSVVPMKECVLNDTRATTLAIKYDNTVDRFVCGSSIERFSGHTGVCRVLGSKKYPIVPHNLQIGDLLRIGSVGLVVCEVNRTTREETQESLSEEEYDFLKEHYLSLPLQQTFHHPTESQRQQQPHDGEHDDDDEDDVIGGHHPANSNNNKHHRRGFRAGETSDEGESEEDRKTADNLAMEDTCEDDDELSASMNGGVERSIGASGMASGKKFCYICYDGDEEPEENPLVAPCNCKGDTKYVHLNCLQRWNNNLDADGTNPNQKVCAVTNTDGLDVCTICKATYLTSVKLDDGRVVSLLAQKLPPPYVTFAVVTQHETRNRQTALTNTRFQLSFANIVVMCVEQLTAEPAVADDRAIDDQQHDTALPHGVAASRQDHLQRLVHVKIGRTILTLKSKKKWKWSGGNNENAEGQGTEYGATVTSPSAADAASFALTPTNVDASSTPVSARSSGINSSNAAMRSRPAPHRSVPNRFEVNGPSMIHDPSAEIVSSPYSLHELLGRSRGSGSGDGFHAITRQRPDGQRQGDTMRLHHLFDDEDAIRDHGHVLDGSSRGRDAARHHHQPFVRVASFSHSSQHNNRNTAAANLPRTRSALVQRREHMLYDIADSLAGLDLASPRVDMDSHRRHTGSPIVMTSSSNDQASGAFGTIEDA
ncbi:Fha domain protein, partial [Globisporangium splendens]